MPPSVGKHLDSPKSAILAWKLSVNNMFVVFTSLCTIGGLQPWCKYSNPAFQSPCFAYLLPKGIDSVIKKRKRKRKCSKSTSC